MHHWMKLFPRIASISWPIDSSEFSLHKDDIIGVAAPHDVNQFTVNFEDIEANFVAINGINSPDFHQETERCKW